MPSGITTIINKRGLHARAATKLAKLAGLFNCSIEVRREAGNWVDAKSVMGLMLMAAAQGTPLEIKTEGLDADQALNEITDLINDFFGEGE